MPRSTYNSTLVTVRKTSSQDRDNRNINMKRQHFSVRSTIPGNRHSPKKDSMRRQLIQLAESYEEATGEEVWLHFGSKASPEKHQAMSIGDLSLSSERPSGASANPQVQLLAESAVCLENVVGVLGQYTATFRSLVAQLQTSVQSLQQSVRDLEDSK